jgi:hypothetical protein
MGRHTYFIGSMGLEGAREIETVNEPAHLFDREDKLVRPETETPRQAAWVLLPGARAPLISHFA